MPQGGLKVSTKGLNDRQIRFIEAYITTGSIRGSAVAAGYPHDTAGYVVLRSSRVQAALHEFRARVINSEGATEALRTLRELMEKGNPPAVRLGAAKTMLGLAGHVEKRPEGEAGKSLAEMGYDELQAIVQRANDVMEGRAASMAGDSAPDQGASLTLAPAPSEEDQAPSP